MCEAVWPAAQLPVMMQFLGMARTPCMVGTVSWPPQRLCCRAAASELMHAAVLCRSATYQTHMIAIMYQTLLLIVNLVDKGCCAPAQQQTCKSCDRHELMIICSCRLEPQLWYQKP